MSSVFSSSLQQSSSKKIVHTQILQFLSSLSWFIQSDFLPFHLNKTLSYISYLQPILTLVFSIVSVDCLLIFESLS